MADTTSRDRWIPALLDRLTDERPERKSEASGDAAVDAWSMSKSQLRDSVLRDLRWLLNAQSHFDAWDPQLADSPALHSVINFGMPALSGSLLEKLELPRFEQTIRQAIIDFEPRIIPETLRVFAQPDPGTEIGNTGALGFGIVAELRAEPYPIELLLRTVIDLDTGDIEVSAGDARPLRTAGGRDRHDPTGLR